MSSDLGINPKTSKPYTVILVDDSRSMRMYLKQFLLSEKFEVISEITMMEAKQLEQSRF